MSRFSRFVPIKIGLMIVTLLLAYMVSEHSDYWWLWVIGYFISISMLFRQEHPKSTARNMAEDALHLEMPDHGGDGKSVIVVGGGISGLTAAKYLLKAGCKVKLVEERPIVAGITTPILRMVNIIPPRLSSHSLLSNHIICNSAENMGWNKHLMNLKI